MYKQLLGYALHWLKRGVSWFDTVFKMIGKYPELPLTDAARITSSAQEAIDNAESMSSNPTAPLHNFADDIIEGFNAEANILKVNPDTGEIEWSTRLPIYSYESLQQALQSFVNEYNADQQLNRKQGDRYPEVISLNDLIVEWVDIPVAANADLIRKYS